MLVQLLLKNGTRKLLAPGLVVKAPDSSTDITFIILLFTGERLIASRHDVIKVLFQGPYKVHSKILKIKCFFLLER